MGGANAAALSYITIIGCSISIVSLVLTILLHGGLPKLRASIPSQLLLNLCIALLSSLLLFILASQAQGDLIQCRTWAIGLHYFWLSAMGWMLVQGVNLYGLIVTVLGLRMDRRLKLYYLGAWGEMITYLFCMYV